jgi:hypothetical protein
MSSSQLPGIRLFPIAHRKSGLRVLAGVTYKSEALTELRIVDCPSRHFAAMQAARARAGVLSVVGNATGFSLHPARAAGISARGIVNRKSVPYGVAGVAQSFPP